MGTKKKKQKKTETEYIIRKSTHLVDDEPKYFQSTLFGQPQQHISIQVNRHTFTTRTCPSTKLNLCIKRWLLHWSTTKFPDSTLTFQQSRQIFPDFRPTVSSDTINLMMATEEDIAKSCLKEGVG